MSGILIYYLANTLMRGGIIVLSLLLLEFFLRRKLVFAGGRWIFLLALLLILLPVERIELPHREKSVYTPASYCIEVPDWNVAWNQTQATAAPVTQALPAVENAVPERVAAPGITGWKWRLFDVLAMVYLAGVLFLWAKQIRHYFIWRNRIRRCIAITDGRVFDVFLESKRLAGLERFPVMLLDSSHLLPVAACFGTLRRGAVLCPLEEYGKYPDSELRMILIHELEHLRRNDNPVAFFLMMLSNCFFINPFVRVISSRWAMTTELDCDEKVKTTLHLDRRGMTRYAELLLASQTRGGAYVPGCGLGASAKNLKLRIQEIVMRRTKLQLLGYFSGICALFVLGCFIMPELRADTREALDPLVAENLPAGTTELVYFNAAALDPAGSALLEKGIGSARHLGRNLWDALYMMIASEMNKGHFYVAVVPDYGPFILLKNGADSDEVVIAPSVSNQNMAARKMPNGYFAMYPAGKKLPAMGLSDELRRKIVSAPGEVIRSCKADNSPVVVSVFNRDGVYTLFTIQPEGKETPSTMEMLLDKATVFTPDNEKEVTRAFIKENLKFTPKKLNGKNFYELEFLLNEKTITFWIDFIRKGQEERSKANAPKVIALSPANGATNVDPDLKEIKVTFDRPMNKTSWSFCQKSDRDFPENAGMPSYDESGTVITMPVRLVPNKTYNIYLNSPPYLGFQSAKRGVLEEVHYTFSTGK